MTINKLGLSGIIFCFLLFLPFDAIAQSQGKWSVDRARKNITLKGYTRSMTSSSLAAEVAGKILGINYDIGQPVGKKPVIVIDAGQPIEKVIPALFKTFTNIYVTSAFSAPMS